MSSRADAPLLHASGLVRCDDVASVLLSPGETIFEIARRFEGVEDHMPFVWRLPWRMFLDDERGDPGC